MAKVTKAFLENVCRSDSAPTNYPWLSEIKLKGTFIFLKRASFHVRGSYRGGGGGGGGSLARFTDEKITNHGSRILKFHFPESRK